MNTNWEKVLLEGEKVVWEGKPAEFKLLDTAGKGKIWAMWIIAAIWIAASFIFYLPYGVKTLGMGGFQLILVMVILDCIPLLFIMMPITDYNILSKNTEYAITDQRVLIRSKERLLTMPLHKEIPVEIRDRGGNIGNVLLGEAGKKSDASLRAVALQGMDRDNTITGVVLYHIASPKQAVKMLP